jgi:RNA polymerase sigma-70 factor (ECF subfamily)
MENPDEREQIAILVIQAQYGDPSALGALVNLHANKIYYFCYRYLRSQIKAEQVAEETCVRVVARINTLKDPRGFTSWLYRIATNLCHDEVKKMKKEVSLSEETLAVLADCGESPEEHLDTTMQREQVVQAISRLSEDHRDVLMLIHYEQLSYDAAAEVLGIEIGTVKSRLSRALQHVRAQLDRSRDKL